MFEKIMFLVKKEGITGSELCDLKELLHGSVELENCQSYFDRDVVECVA